MQRRYLGIAGLLVLFATASFLPLFAQAERGPYARIAFLRPHDGDTVDFEAGYMRHLEWHRQAKDAWTWYGWSVWAGDRQRWFAYATFGHAAGDFDNPVPPADDERDNIANVTPHAEFTGNGLYEYLPALSRGTGEPTPTMRLELTTVQLATGTASAFEAELAAEQTTLKGETLWYRMVAGGMAPRYVRLRPQSTLAAIIAGANTQALPDKANAFVEKTTIEILTLRPAMCYGITPVRQ